MKVRMTNYQANCYAKGSQLNPIIKKTLICFSLLEIKADNLRQIFEHIVYFTVLAVLKVVLHIQVEDI